jgi:hypothetical protein
MPVRVCLWFATLILSIITSTKRRGNPDWASMFLDSLSGNFRMWL